MTSLLASGSWVGTHGIRSIRAVMEELVQQARQRILLSVYSLNEGAGTLFDRLGEAAARGVRIQVIADRAGVGDWGLDLLNRLSSSHPGAVEIHWFEGGDGSSLHAKVLAVDATHAIVGSANFTHRGLVRSQELGVLLDGEPARNAFLVIQDLFTQGE